MREHGADIRCIVGAERVVRFVTPFLRGFGRLVGDGDIAVNIVRGGPSKL